MVLFKLDSDRVTWVSLFETDVLTWLGKETVNKLRHRKQRIEVELKIWAISGRKRIESRSMKEKNKAVEDSGLTFRHFSLMD